MLASQWSVPQQDKETLLLSGLNDLSKHHSANCKEYGRITNALWDRFSAARVEDVPFVPVSLFKSHRLSSVPHEAVRMTMTSSGTTGSSLSKIAIDHETTSRQARSLNASISAVVGGKRPPMLVVDSETVVRDPKLLSARGAGVLGMMRFGRDHCFLLDGDMKFRREALRDWVAKHQGTPILIFGFTFLVWQFLYSFTQEDKLDLSNGVLVHSGGWKKLQSEAVSPDVFRASFHQSSGLSRIYNFYGMVEQMGAICLEASDGFLYPPNIADVIIRDPATFAPLAPGKEGLIQMVSLVPTSYPGHSVLTEDLGVIEYIDRGVDGRLGKALRVIGRLPKTELRGCSDVVAASLAA
ncbi:acyl-protein synthetase [Oricola cellulosilytica]|uniref:Acyl-protein synthetase n=2 Tax=Oricola cellulosilytica TaxID=1429082 RepID=A0A4R0PJB0_9HYPH|nr:acyl-protein synthetase [Oricola cellulosilytica]